MRVLRASHVIKGAAANLMCAQLRLCALQLEMAAQTAANDADGLKNPAVMTELKERHEELKNPEFPEVQAVDQLSVHKAL